MIISDLSFLSKLPIHPYFQLMTSLPFSFKQLKQSEETVHTLQLTLTSSCSCVHIPSSPLEDIAETSLSPVWPISLSTGAFPSAEKLATICPMF